MEKAKKIIMSEKIECSAEIYDKNNNNLEDIILEHTKKVNGDLLMIMTHQEVGVLDNYIGAVAQKVLRQADVPVVSFNSKAMGNRFDFISAFLPIEMLSNKKELEKLKGE